MTPKQLRQRILKLPVSAPVTEAFEARLAETTTSLREAWYENQREHWLGWLKEYDGPGYYGRSNWEVNARSVYNRVGNPAMVQWLGEAAGIPTSTVKKAASEAMKLRGSFSRQCGAIRSQITWDMIEDRIKAV
jgi:hypothetical protein